MESATSIGFCILSQVFAPPPRPPGWSPDEVALKLGRDAAVIVCDRGYLRHQRRWRDRVADGAGCRVEQVESDVVVPVEEVSRFNDAAHLHGVRADPLKRIVWSSRGLWPSTSPRFAR